VKGEEKKHETNEKYKTNKRDMKALWKNYEMKIQTEDTDSIWGKIETLLLLLLIIDTKNILQGDVVASSAELFQA
jgi:hypothetical protein